MDEITAEEPISSDYARAACRSAVITLMARGAWTCAGEEELVDRVWRAAGPDASSATFDRLAKHHYSALLYEACLQNRDPQKREAAFGDLHRVLYRAAYNRWPELAEDAAQRALVLVYVQLDRCREPGTFLAFALNKLRHAFQQEQRARKGSDVVLDDLAEMLADGQAGALAERLLSAESTAALLQAIERLPYPRQRSVVLWKFFGGLSDEDIGHRLGITSGHVRVLRHRGVDRLRADAAAERSLVKRASWFSTLRTVTFCGSGSLSCSDDAIQGGIMTWRRPVAAR